MFSKSSFKFFALSLLGFSFSAFASAELLDPKTFGLVFEQVEAQNSMQHQHATLGLLSQDQARELYPDLSDILKNTAESEYGVFNARLNTFFFLHNSRPTQQLDLDATTNPFFNTFNGAYANKHFGGLSADLYGEAFRFFSFNLKPYFMLHDDPTRRNVFIQEAYGSVHFNALTFDLGKTRLHWGQGAYQPMVFGDDYDPFFMLRLRNNRDIHFDGFLKFLGDIRFEMMYGWLDEHHVYPNGNIIGTTFSFQLNKRLQVHFDETVLFGGDGAPTHNPLVFFSESFLDTRQNLANRNFVLGFRYRIPFLEIEPYADFYAEDCCGSNAINPRNVLNLVGLYVPPKDAGKKFDYTVEWVRTNYITYRHDAFDVTNSQKVLGHPIGRDSMALYGKVRYFHSRDLQFDNMLTYEIRSYQERAFISSDAFVDIRTAYPFFEDKERRIRFKQTASYFINSKWRAGLDWGIERVLNYGYLDGNHRWQGLFGLQTSYNF